MTNEEARKLWTEYGRYIYTIVHNNLRSVGTIEDIEECTADAFSAVCKDYDTGKLRDGNVKGFIAKVAKRKAYNYYRTFKSSALRENIEVLESDENVEYEVADRDLQKKVIDLISSFGEPDATIILQKFYFGRKYKDIAKMVSMTPGAVRVRCSRLKKTLGSEIKKLQLLDICPNRNSENINSDFLEFVFDSIKNLGEPDAVILIQKYYYNRDLNEISKMVSMSTTQVKKQISTAISKLNEEINKTRDFGSKSSESIDGKFLEDVFQTIGKLGESYSTIIIQKYYFKRNIKEISEMVFLSPETVEAGIEKILNTLMKSFRTDVFNRGENNE